MKPSVEERFLSTHNQIANVFSGRPDQDTAAKFRAARSCSATGVMAGQRQQDGRSLRATKMT